MRKILLATLLTVVILFLNSFIIGPNLQLPQYSIPFDLDLQMGDNNADNEEKILVDNVYINMPISCPAVYTSIGSPMVMITNSGSCASDSYHPIGIFINIFISGLIATGLVLAGGRLTMGRMQKNR